MDLEPTTAAVPDTTDADPYRAYLDSLGPQSRRAMQGCLDRIARLLSGDPHVTGAHQPWHLLRHKHTAALPAQMRRQDWSAAYINKHLTALRQVLKRAWLLGLMSTDDYHRAVAIEAPSSQRLPAGRHLPAELITDMFAACDADTSPHGSRDAAIIAVLYSTGCRRAELCATTTADWDHHERSLRLLGKGDKQRLVHLNPAATGRLLAWLNMRGPQQGPIFSPISRHGSIRYRDNRPAPMSGQAIADVVTRRLRAAGHPTATPHDFRRTFIGEMLDHGVDLATTQEIVGHASPATTARYDRRPARRRREAVDRLSLPGG